MTISPHQLQTEIFYPDSDGEPMAESDPARDYLIYAVEALDIYFQDRQDVYVSKLLSYREMEQARLVAEQARLDAIPRLLQLGLSAEQVAVSLSFSVDEGRQFVPQ